MLKEYKQLEKKYEEYKQLVNYFVNKFAFHPENLNADNEVVWAFVRYDVFNALVETVGVEDTLIEYLKHNNPNYKTHLKEAIEKFKRQK